MSTAASELLLPDYPIMQGVEIINARAGELYDCNVPLDLIEQINAPVDYGNIEKLKKDIAKQRSTYGGSGQIKAGHFGYVANESFFRIIDGFHRFDLFTELGESSMLATIQLLPLDDLLDQRILNANMHDNVIFARKALWMGESWAIQPLSEKLKITSAFILAHFDDYKGSEAHLTDDEVTYIREWATKKADAWGTTVSSIYQNLKTAGSLAPELVPNVRPAKAVKNAASQNNGPSITSSMANTFSAKLGGLLDHQRLIATLVDPYNLNGAQVNSIATVVADLSIEEAHAYVDKIDWNAKQKKDVKVFKYKESDFFRESLIRGSSAVQPLIEVAALTTDSIYEVELNELPRSKLIKLRDDLDLVASQINSMREAVNGAVQTDKNSTKLELVPKPIYEPVSIAAFSTALANGLDNGEFPDIENIRQLELAELTVLDPDLSALIDAAILARLKIKIANFKEA